MGSIKDKFLATVENKGSKKTIENLVVFVIILIATIIFINYIWNGDKNKTKQEEKNATYAGTSITSNDTNNNKSLEKQIEDILKNLEGVEDVKVLITYSETNKVIPMYNEDNQQSTTQEEDNQGRCQDNRRKF